MCREGLEPPVFTPMGGTFTASAVRRYGNLHVKSAPGRIRTDTVWNLRPATPTNWSTGAKAESEGVEPPGAFDPSCLANRYMAPTHDGLSMKCPRTDSNRHYLASRASDSYQLVYGGMNRVLVDVLTVGTPGLASSSVVKGCHRGGSHPAAAGRAGPGSKCNPEATKPKTPSGWTGRGSGIRLRLTAT
jgi:hypothetical protein